MIGNGKHHAGRGVILADFIINPCGDTQVFQFFGGKLISTDHPGADGAGVFKVLALGDIEFGMPDPVPNGSFIHDAEPGNMRKSIFTFDATTGLADNHYDFTLVIQLFGFGRAQNRLFMCRQGIRKAHKYTGLGRRIAAILVFGISVGIVDPNTENFFRCRDWRLQYHVT